MTYQLVIAEKKSLADDIFRALGLKNRGGDGYLDGGNIKVSWASGHLVSQAEPQEYGPQFANWNVEDLPVIPAPFKMVVKKDPATKKTDARALKQYKLLKELHAGASSVVNAGDPDREGQLIVDELLTLYRNRLPVKRLWLHAQTNEGIKTAWAQMKDNADWGNLSQSAQCRSELDWLIGMNGTRGYTVLWKQKGNVGVLNVGRVKAPTISIVVMREQEIINFKPHDYYFVRALCSHQNGKFSAKWMPAEKNPPEFDESGRLLNKTVAQAVVAKTRGKPGQVSKVEALPKKSPPPLMLNLGELQKLANKFGISPDKTLEHAQKLYSTYKLTTYPRTTCRYAPEEMHAKSASVLKAVRENNGDGWKFKDVTFDTSIKSGAWNDAKLEEHYAIMPTAENFSVHALSQDEKIVYGLIVQHFLAQFMPWYEYTTTTVVVKCDDYLFQAQGAVPTKLGWRELFGGAPVEKDADGEDVQSMPAMKAGDLVKIDSVDVDTKATKPPSRYDGASLIDAMENAHRYVTDPKVKKTLKNVEGLGTPATRAEIVKSLIRDGFISEQKEGKRIIYHPTQKAFAYVKAIPPMLGKVDFTAWFEGKLDDIAQGRMKADEFREMAQRFVHKLVDDMKNGTVLNLMPERLVTELPTYRPAAPSKGAGAGTRKAAPRKTAGSRSGGRKAG